GHGLDLPGYKIPVIENLGATLDQFDAIDFSDNEIRKLDGFPLLRRLKTLLMNNNRICRIGENLEQALPNLTELILTNNNIAELVKTLYNFYLLCSVLRNPVTNKKHYRLYVIHKVPQVRVLDFQKVKLKVSLLSFDSAQDGYFFFLLRSCKFIGNSNAVVIDFIETVYPKWL
uniref:Small nuclear ribonucleoprotein polypeptide A' n=1 Tax=Athene cunicularia TaxID=194338 RepID=A0A663MY92_ATHCN